MKLIPASATRLSRIWCAVLGAVPAKRRVDCTVQVAAEDAFDLGMARDDFGKTHGIVEAVIVHVGNARRERRMMHQDHGRPIRLCSERRVEPAEPLGAQHPAMLAGDERVERDRPQRVIFDRVLQVAIGRQVADIPKGLAQRLSSVMVAGDYKDRHRQPCEQMAQLFVFFGLAVINKIAGHDGDIGPWHQRVQGRDCARQIWRGAELAPGPRVIRRSACMGQRNSLPAATMWVSESWARIMSPPRPGSPLGKAPRYQTANHPCRRRWRSAGEEGSWGYLCVADGECPEGRPETDYVAALRRYSRSSDQARVSSSIARSGLNRSVFSDALCWLPQIWFIVSGGGAWVV